jgi:hypothetical protein
MRSTLSLLSFFAIATIANAQTNVSGFINANTTWTTTGSPYIVVGNTLLQHGYTLTIDPDVVVKFNDSTVLQIDGELIAIGTSVRPITFTSNQSSPAPGDWGKIHFSDTCVDAVFDANGNYLSGSIMKYCDVMYGGGIGYGEIHIDDAAPYFSNCKILNSSEDGIHTINTGYRIDSSLIKNNNGSGLYFQNMTYHSCNLMIQKDSIVSNNDGGIVINPISTTLCTGIVVEILNNYFITNNNSAISLPHIGGVLIKGNEFVGNTSTSGGIITSSNLLWDYIIECNYFLNNQTTNKGVICIEEAVGSYGYINNNIFENNYSSSGASTVNVEWDNCFPLIHITENLFISNTCINGSCCLLQPCLNSADNKLYFNSNEFRNNTATNIVMIVGFIQNNSTYHSMNFKYNNFINNNSQYLLNNGVPYGSQNIYADSNYWGSTNTQHIDSVIFDFFDYGNLSVVYYSPLLTSPVNLDTTCHSTAIGIPELQKQSQLNSSLLFPNPFTTHSTLSFTHTLYNATLHIYNMYGQVVQQQSQLNANEVIIDRKQLANGIYIYAVEENNKRIASGKAVVY